MSLSRTLSTSPHCHLQGISRPFKTQCQPQPQLVAPLYIAEADLRPFCSQTTDNFGKENTFTDSTISRHWLHDAVDPSDPGHPGAVHGDQQNQSSSVQQGEPHCPSRGAGKEQGG